MTDTTPSPDPGTPAVSVPFPGFWRHNAITPDTRAETEHDLVELLGDRVADPEAVASDMYASFMGKVESTGSPVMIASFAEELPDGKALAASLTVTHNELTGSLDQWRAVYGEVEELTVADRAAIRVVEESAVPAGIVSEEELTIVGYRYIVQVDDHSMLLFNFSTPNSALADLMLDHFESIMAGVTITGIEPPSGADEAGEATPPAD